MMAVAVAAVITGTNAFFGDQEVSSGNTFAAGAIDLQIDNESYYNGNVCDEVEVGVWQWVGDAPYPEAGTPCTTSFLPSDLEGLYFFYFHDLKPDDEGEDTISIHAENDAWVCMDLTLTSNDDNSSTEPELGTGDDPDNENDVWDGELANALNFFWWADDGDNVYEEGENPITDEVVNVTELDALFPLTLADSESNVWGEEGPIPANDTAYIAKAWCFGGLTLDPVPSGEGVNPSVNPGVDCDGTLLGNEYQTDGLELNLVFSATQARHDEEFLCNPSEEPLPTLTVNKIITASTGNIDVTDFELHITGPGGDQVVTDEVPVPNLPVGPYTVSEVLIGDAVGVDFTVTFGGACDSGGNVTLGLGDNLVCTITNVEVIEEPLSVFTEDFGAGDCLPDIPGWEEDAGESCVNGTVAKDPGTGDNSVSPEGGRFGLLSGNNGYICRSIDATGYEDLVLDYYWRGDAGANDGETGSVHYFTTGNCAAPGPLSTLATHELDDGDNNVTEPWSALQSIALPGSLDNSTFFVRFTADSNSGNESFRVDGVEITGTLI